VEVAEMCNYSDGVAEAAFEKGIKQGIEKGQIQGSVEAYKEFGVSMSDTIAKIAAKYNLSETDAKEQVEKYWD
jgi:flagellar biosynthesis/type III secretory pathway protein FliH